MTPPVPAELVERAARLADSSGRALLGLTGPPGAGKSTLATGLVEALGGGAVLVPMDGFHLDDVVLDALGRRDRKGAPDTFDAGGYVALLRRLRDRSEEVVYAPEFRRELEIAAAGAVAVPRDVPLIVTEGNYLLYDGPFAPVRGLLDETWFLDVDPTQRQLRLVARHVGHGRSPEAARRWVETTDEPNARLVERTRAAASLVVRLPA
ncbi:MAG TPA: nucleoside/nucleotide kinase family protein [Mycobacteriales bacterium]|nr:nucleoside/nucleotide kinase family protein [Mycobacteriales bacterium]